MIMRLSTREFIAVSVAGACLALAAVYLLLIEPVNGHLASLDKSIVTQQRTVAELERMTRNFSKLKGRIADLERKLNRSANFSILSHLEGLARRLDVKGNIVQMKPKQGINTKYYRENVVEIKMERVSLQLLVRYLYQIENSPELLRIKQLKVKPRFDNRDQLDAIIQVSAYEPSNPEQG